MSLPHVDAPSNRRGVVLMGLHRVGSPSSSGLTKQLAPKNRLNRNESSEHVRALSCPPVEVHIAAPMGLPVRVPTPPCSSPSPRKLQSPYESSDAHQALRVTRSWETHQILSEPDKFHEGAVTEAARKVRLGIINTDPQLLSRESASLIMHRSRAVTALACYSGALLLLLLLLHVPIDGDLLARVGYLWGCRLKANLEVQSQKVASQSLEIEDLRAQITKWKNAARGMNKESKGQQKEVARLEAEVTAAKRSREELLYALEQAHERNAFLESSLTSSQRSLHVQVGLWCRGQVPGASNESVHCMIVYMPTYRQIVYNRVHVHPMEEEEEEGRRIRIRGYSYSTIL